MSEGTPDLSRVISLIMENPKLVEQISGLVKSELKEESEITDSSEPVSTEEEKSAATEVAAEAVTAPVVGARQNRARLMSALKPYVSESRQKALDSFLSIADILDLMRSK